MTYDQYRKQKDEKLREFQQEKLETFASMPQERLQLLDEKVNGSTITSRIDKVKSHHYFKHVGDIIGATGFAHLAFSINFTQLQESLDHICRCATEDFHHNRYWKSIPERVQKRLATDSRINEMASRCADTKAEILASQYSFTKIKTQTNFDAQTRKALSNYLPLKTDINELDIIETYQRKPSYTPGRRERDTYGPYINLQPNKRTKRAAIAAVITVLGMVGTGISSGVTGWMANSWYNQRNDEQIIEMLDQHDLEIEQIKDDFAAITAMIHQQQNEMESQEAMILFNGYTDICSQEIDRHRDNLRNVLNAINLLLHKRLHPALINPDRLRQKLDNIDERARQRHQQMGISSINHLYMLETTYFTNHNDSVTAMVHVPLFQLSSLMTLWEFVPTPVIEEAGNNIGKVYRIVTENNLIARSQAEYFMEISLNDLNQCHKAGKVFICDKQSVMKRSKTIKSCLNALFTNDNEQISETCDIEFTSQPENEVIQIDSNRFFTYFPTEQRLDIDCENFKIDNSMSKALKGIFIVTIPDGCSGKTPTHKFSSVGSLGTYQSFVGIRNDFNITKLSSNSSMEEWSTLFEELEEEGQKKINIPKLKSRQLLKRLWYNRYHPSTIASILSFIGGLVVIVTVLSMCGCFPKKFVPWTMYSRVKDAYIKRKERFSQRASEMLPQSDYLEGAQFINQFPDPNVQFVNRLPNSQMLTSMFQPIYNPNTYPRGPPGYTSQNMEPPAAQQHALNSKDVVRPVASRPMIQLRSDARASTGTHPTTATAPPAQSTSIGDLRKLINDK